MTELDRIFKNSEKADLLEELKEILEQADPKVIIVCVTDHKDDGGFASQVLMLGVCNTYEGLGILEIGRQRIYDNDDLI